MNENVLHETPTELFYEKKSDILEDVRKRHEWICEFSVEERIELAVYLIARFHQSSKETDSAIKIYLLFASVDQKNA